MKKTILTLAAIFIVTQLFSQDVEKITIISEASFAHQLSDGDYSYKQLIKTQPYSKGFTERSMLIYDIKNMKSYFSSNLQQSNVADIVKYEVLNDGTIHIVCNEQNILFPGDTTKRILTHKYINTDKNLSVYTWKWENLKKIDPNNIYTNVSRAVQDLNPEITIY